MTRLSTLVIVFWSCGCQLHEVTPNPPPPVDVPETFDATSDGVDAVDRWWESFEDVGLNETIDKALKQNLDLQQAWARMEQARALIGQANAAALPQLEAGLNVSRQRIVTKQVTPSYDLDTQELDYETQDVAREMDNYRVSLAAAYEVDIWGRVASLQRAAALEHLAGRADLSFFAMTLTAQVVETWFMLAEQFAMLDLMTRQLETNKTMLDLVVMRFRQGLAGALDVRQQQQQLRAMQAEMPLIESRLDVLRTQLAVLLGRPPQADLELSMPRLPDPSPIPETGLPSDVLQRRPDVRAAQLRVMASDSRLGAAIADQFPALRLSGSIGFGSGQVETLFTSWIYNLAAGLTAPLFDGGRRAAEVTRQRAVVKELVLAYGDAVLQAFKEVEDAVSLERQQRRHLQRVALRLVSANKTLREARRRYLEGVGDYLPVLGALQTVQQVERLQVTGRRQQLAYRVQLHRALGGHWANALRPEPPKDTPGPSRGDEAGAAPRASTETESDRVADEAEVDLIDGELVIEEEGVDE